MIVEFVKDENDFTKYVVYQWINGNRYKIKVVQCAKMKAMKEQYLELYGEVEFRFPDVDIVNFNKEVKELSYLAETFCTQYYYCKALDEIIKLKYKIKLKQNDVLVLIRYYEEHEVVNQDFNEKKLKYLSGFFTTTYDGYIRLDSLKRLVKRLKVGQYLVPVSNSNYKKYISDLRGAKKSLKDNLL